MAAGHARPPGLGLAKAYRQFPSPVRYALANMLGLIARMCLMARPTRPTPTLLINMKKMKILVTVSKVR
jgi:hypothetical protein